ncbi:hypothetical protein M422DRAFT_276134 [Sphaerobolus stellatus SS14]|uniref:cystathionine gamma-lyase n=1 Tax=Sphaerobolus stellatus (strain SS14) TaxID=990650 RepID=A0A0C9T374_SPHS4|nr:hypothetical protein M422DRAFT_276134 [Sphaerobolus stellatus SS14]
MGAVILPNASTTETNGNKYTIDTLYTRLQFLQSTHDVVPGAFDAWLALRGAKTLSLRMKEHGWSAITRSLMRLSTPVLRSIEVTITQRRSWLRMRGKGDFPFAGVVSFRIGSAGELADDGAVEKFLTRTRLFTLAGNLGDVENCRRAAGEDDARGNIRPAERLALGIAPHIVRLGVGVEDVDDMIADVHQALSWAVNGWNSASTSVASRD